jgi:hypothetical protein
VRALLAALVLLLAPPSFAADWGHYFNVRYGFATDVPPDFVGQGEADNSDGQVFTTPTAELRVFGANVLAADFEAEVREREAADASAGWALTYKVSTPTAASWSGRQGSRILYVRAIALCRGTQIGILQFTYMRADIATFDAVVERLVRAFRPTEGSAMC